MSTPNYKPVTDEELARIEIETRRRDRIEPRVQKARYEPEARHLILEMRGGSIVSAPLRLFPSLSKGKAEDVARVKVVSRGAALHWDELDVQMTTVALLQILFHFQTTADNARRAGRVKSPFKTAAARENGRKGGRPKTKV